MFQTKYDWDTVLHHEPADTETRSKYMDVHDLLACCFIVTLWMKKPT